MPALTTHSSQPALKRLATNTLGARLDAIFALVARVQQLPEQRYDGIWDCCCDHGYLGMKLLAAQLCPSLYFVDQVPHIIADLAEKLASLDDGRFNGRYQTITLDAAALTFPPGQRHLVMLTGVGGEHIVDIMGAIAKCQHSCQIDYLLCPATTQFDLREYLVAERFDLQHEQLVAEKGRDYEVILVSSPTPSGTKVSPTGAMWDANNPNHMRYRAKLMRHYQQQTLGREPRRAERAAQILSHYRNCLIEPPKPCEPA